jgi:hypothetical protein
MKITHRRVQHGANTIDLHSKQEYLADKLHNHVMGHLVLKLVELEFMIGRGTYRYSPSRGNHIWNVLRLLDRCGNPTFELQKPGKEM